MRLGCMTQPIFWIVRRTSLEDMNCSIARTLEVVRERWTLLIIRDGLVGVTRFSELQSSSV